MIRNLQRLLSLIILIGAFQAHGKLFRNSYVSFELPSNWNCKLEGTEWVCTSLYAKKAKEAIIILTAKEAGPSDQLPIYFNHLRLPRTILGPKGKTIKSKLIHVKKRRIANHEWVDGMHLGSEIYSYYSRYLATKKNQVAILVTFSAHQMHYTKYSRDFLSAIESLRVVAGKNLLNKQYFDRPKGGLGSGHIGVPIGDLSMGEGEDYVKEDSTLFGKNAEKIVGLLFILGAIALYFFYKKTSANKKGSKHGRK